MALGFFVVALQLGAARAQVPAVEELGSTWQPVRMCRPHPTDGVPLQPCNAGGSLDPKSCADFGCCSLPSKGAHGPDCYAPNGGSPGSADQAAFGASQAVVSMSQPGGALSADRTGDLLGVECFSAPPFSGARRPNHW